MTSYVKIPVFHFFEKVNKGQLKMASFSYQGFPNSGMGGIGNFTGRGGFFLKRTWGGVILMIQTFFKAKNSFPWMLNIT